MNLNILIDSQVNHSTLFFCSTLLYALLIEKGQSKWRHLCFQIALRLRLKNRSETKGEREGNVLILATVKAAWCIRLDILESTNLMACIQCDLFLMIWASLLSAVPCNVLSPCEDRSKFYRHCFLSIKYLNYFIFIWAMLQGGTTRPVTLHMISLLRKSPFQVPPLSLRSTFKKHPAILCKCWW